MVYADEKRLQQILYNLIGNAIKYTEQGKIVISSEHHGHFLKVRVTDTGKGITKQEQEIIFEPFRQGYFVETRETSGTGIGLTITKRLVELHHGQLFLESELGIGTEISFTLPIVSNREELQAGKEAGVTIEPFIDVLPSVKMNVMPVTAKKTKSAKILIADDEPVNLQVLRNQLVLDGYEVTTAHDGEQVIQYVQAERFDLLILDIMMPKMSGYDVCQKLRKNYSLMELPILMLTAKNQVRDVITSFEVGANDYLTKSCDKEELLSRVKTLVHLRNLNEELLEMNQKLEQKVQQRTEALEIANDDLMRINDDLIAMTESRRLLLANIAHELATPLTLIHSYVQALQAGVVLADDLHYQSLVYDKINVLNRLINDLADLSKLEAGQASLEFNMIRLDKWIMQLNQRHEFTVTQGGRKYIQDVKDEESLRQYTCLIDMERMDQVFSNLVQNAIRHTSLEDGEISISVALDEGNQEVVFKINDNGTGISEENLPYLFERFFKAEVAHSEERQQGTGLGLAIVKEIVTGHNGEIWVESKLHKGTTFYISLPIQRFRKGENKHGKRENTSR